MSSRKVQVLKWREGQRRKSPRVYSLDKCKSRGSNLADDSVRISPQNDIAEKRNDSQDQEEGPASRTRARNKRKLPIPHDDDAALRRILGPLVVEVIIFFSKLLGSLEPRGCCSFDCFCDTSEFSFLLLLEILIQVRSIRRHEDHEVDSDEQQVMQDRAKSKLGDHDENRNNGQQSAQCLKLSPTPEIPEKRVLELVIDTLQRRDTYEIFGEPVDPTEVEDYYKIIEEPMDFGTMRAKLHEGMYGSLEQFEHDAFLITKNAMHFNPSGTTYFRQARAIHELAKQVFHILRTNPNDFELQFSETRRVTRRSQAEVRGQTNSSSRRTHKNVRSSQDTSSRASQSARGPSNLRNASTNSRSFRTASLVQASNGPIFGYSRDWGRQSSLPDADWRSSYRPGTSLLNRSDPVSKTIGCIQPLMHVKQQDIGYRESLVLFSKGLGPAAQKTVERKLRALDLALDTFGLDVPQSLQENRVSRSSPSSLEKNKSIVGATNAWTEISGSHNRRDSCLVVNKPCNVGASSKTNQPERAASQFLFDLPYLKERLDQMISSGPERSAHPSLQAEKPSSNGNAYRPPLICDKEPNIHCYSRKRRGTLFDPRHHTDSTL
ncbi:uncharacterized protein LOC115731030 [Rhodamnia argentea]|uniref:Uncharacterized protein LOC115731030 n=1 Tax=Rhodamnia argentea TaxID=178133 RepID=A0ABM3GSJ2_9MYRT|nr:uncharacterized protein LOC115731030 [Rhodamnia argentea]